MPQSEPSKYQVRLGERIRYVREELRHQTQKQVAKKAGIGQSTLAMIEVAKQDATLSTLTKIAETLDVDLATLFASESVFVFDMERLRKKYRSERDLTEHLFFALSRVIQYAREIGHPMA